MYTFRNNDRRCGEWDAGNLKHPLAQLTDTVLRAVQVYIIFIIIIIYDCFVACVGSYDCENWFQSARRTAEKAINLRRVDEHVNNAVIAANRAASAARVAAVKAVQNRMDGKFCDTTDDDDDDDV